MHDMTKSQVTKITIARLYNLGSYEHERYEICVEVPDGQSAAEAMIGVKKIMQGLAPASKSCTKDRAELARERRRIADMRDKLTELGEEEFRRRHGFYEGTATEYIGRCEQRLLEDTLKRDKWELRAEKARKLLDDLGGAAVWKDAKLDWENDYDDQP